VGLNIPNGEPLVYELDAEFKADSPLLPQRDLGRANHAQPRLISSQACASRSGTVDYLLQLSLNGIFLTG
jgi:hypothetical protein